MLIAQSGGHAAGLPTNRLRSAAQHYIQQCMVCSTYAAGLAAHSSCSWAASPGSMSSPTIRAVGLAACPQHMSHVGSPLVIRLSKACLMLQAWQQILTPEEIQQRTAAAAQLHTQFQGQLVSRGLAIDPARLA